MRNALIALVVCGWSLSFACGGKKLFAEEAESLESLRHAKLIAAQEWWKLLVARSRAGSPDASPAEELRAAETLKNADLDLAANKQDRIHAFEQYRDRVKSIYDIVEKLTKVGTAGGEPGRLAEVRIRLLEAKIRLKEEEAK